MAYTGELLSFLVACCWTVSALSFERAGKIMGSLPMNLIRLVLAMIFLGIYSGCIYGRVFPSGLSSAQWMWLSLSGVVGLFLGDICLFKSYGLIGSRFSQLIMTLVPVFSGVLGWFFLSEKLTFLNMLAILVTLSGIALAITGKQNGSLKWKLPVSGVLYALGGVVGQSLGLMLSKMGVGTLDPFEATQVRMLASIPCFLLLMTLTQRWNSVHKGIRSGKGMAYTLAGAFFGAFLGVSLSLMAIQYAPLGISSTLMSLVPVLIILPSVWIFRQKVTSSEIWGAVVSVVGVSLFFL